jgi:hypothetical protein
MDQQQAGEGDGATAGGAACQWERHGAQGGWLAASGRDMVLKVGGWLPGLPAGQTGHCRPCGSTAGGSTTGGSTRGGLMVDLAPYRTMYHHSDHHLHVVR